MASRGVNKVILLGNVGSVESRQMPNGETVVNLSIATSEVWNDKNSGQKQERTEWHRCTAYRKTAEIIAQYVNKGDKLYLEGSLQTRKYQAQDGSDRYVTEIIVSNTQFVGGGNNQQQGNGQKNYQQNNQRQQQPQQNYQQQNSNDQWDDEIPF